MEDNVDYRLLRYWRSQRWPALYAAAAEAHDAEVEERLADLVERLEARGVPPRSNVIGLLGPDDR
jgi:predicted ArsR family transcriptional regulator